MATVRGPASDQGRFTPVWATVTISSFASMAGGTRQQAYAFPSSTLARSGTCRAWRLKLREENRVMSCRPNLLIS